MKQVFQHMGSGELSVLEVPAPLCGRENLLVGSHFSLISPGTERATTAIGQKNLIAKAKARPDLVRQVFQMAREQGVATTVRKVQDRLDEFKPLGYCSAGVVLEVGDGCSGFAPGDRVACAGGGYAVHAQVVSVPRNLCANVPEKVSLDQAAYTTLGSIALHGVRQAEVTLGETVGIIGLGLVGQLATQILKASGCIVLGIDLQADRLELVRSSGADAACTPGEAHSIARSMTGDTGLDAVLIAASTSSNEPLKLAADLLRDRGRIVVIGAVGMGLEREPFYSKEIDLRLSRSYGPGRYDPGYEEGGHDYPIGYVRWTEQRNMVAFLELVRSGKVCVDRLTTHRFSVDRAVEAYDLIKQSGESLGVLIEYGNEPVTHRVDLSRSEAKIRNGSPTVGFIGAGSFAQTHLIPVVKAQKDVALTCVVTRTGGNARKLSEKHGFASCATNADVVLGDEKTDVVFIATRHDTHASLTTRALRAGKHIFVEKPLALVPEELVEMEEAYRKGSTVLQVGFNRRFAPLTTWAMGELSSRDGPTCLIYRVNAGMIPADHWIRSEEGGGRILGEICHFIDFAQHVLASPFLRVFAQHLRGGDPRVERDNVQVQLQCENGSAATIVYVANGDRSMRKERVELFRGGVTVVIEDFHEGWLHASGKKSKARVASGKGHREEVEAFLEAVKTGSVDPISFQELLHTTRTTFAVVDSLNSGLPVDPRLIQEG